MVMSNIRKMVSVRPWQRASSLDPVVQRLPDKTRPETTLPATRHGFHTNYRDDADRSHLARRSREASSTSGQSLGRDCHHDGPWPRHGCFEPRPPEFSPGSGTL